MRNFEIISHRGASALCLENTIEAYNMATKMGSKWVEIDVHMSKDKVAIISHDQHLKSKNLSLGEKIDIAKFSYKDIVKMASKGDGIPTLEEALDCIKDGGAGVYLEIKPGDLQSKHLKRILNILKNSKINAVVSSFDLDIVQKSHKPDQWQTMLLVEKLPTDGLRRVVISKADQLGVCINKSTWVSMRKIVNKVPLYAYTVNDIKSIERAKKEGLSGVFCDWPQGPRE